MFVKNSLQKEQLCVIWLWLSSATEQISADTYSLLLII